ncbi:MAG: hemolysin III family protein [Candidatus Schekmanbacteria bacterium]|nr:hemolysin III family protein [Candidatus Schekmanbacteria bacterium]
MTREAEAQGYSVGEELANSITHGVGALLAIAGLGVLVASAALYGTAWHVVSCSVFGSTLVLLYMASTLYHSIPHAGAKPILRLLDHCAIFALIAGTYTPFTLVNLRGPWGWSLFAVIWGLAALGIVLRVVSRRDGRGAMIWLYIAMGWAIVVAAKPLAEAVAPGGLALLAAGGVAYTAGTVFFGWKALPYNHAIWHLFVLAGSALHFFAILYYVIPLAA